MSDLRRQPAGEKNPTTLPKTSPDEKAIIEEILQRRRLKQPRIPGNRVRVFKEKLGEEIARGGQLTQEFVDALLQKVKNGEL